MNKKSNAILNALKNHYPSIGIALNFSNNWELLVATILSAQCTDKRVNQITSFLFKEFVKIEDYASRPLVELERIIRPVGFFRAKSQYIQGSAQKILKEHNGTVPDTMEQLLPLPGVGRKTANVVLFNGFSKNSGIAIDTHVGRISQLLGLSSSKNPLKIEEDLMHIYPRKEWGNINHRLVQYGRDVCVARRPRCADCVLTNYCDHYQNIKKRK